MPLLTRGVCTLVGVAEFRLQNLTAPSTVDSRRGYSVFRFSPVEWGLRRIFVRTNVIRVCFSPLFPFPIKPPGDSMSKDILTEMDTLCFHSLQKHETVLW